jgi:hypothetical protein
MDKLAKQLREDAERIECTVSEELDKRIQASLRATEAETVKPRGRGSRPVLYWWASSLTGVAAAVAVIAIVNLKAPEAVPETPDPAATPLILPSIQWNTETAVLTSPLEQEIEDLQSDLKKAEEAVKQDIDRLF